MVSNCCWNIKRDLKLNMRDNQETENFYHSSYIDEGFISAVSLLNDLMKLLVNLGILNCIIFKYLGSDCYCKNSIPQ